MERVSFDVEFLFRSSPTILYKFFTVPSAIIRWFCDEADIEDEVYTFAWDGAEETAEMIDDIEDERVRFRWEDSESDDEYWEIRFSIDDQRQFWESQIKKLRMATGG